MNRSSVKLWGSAILAAACLTIPATSFAGILSNKERVSLVEPAEPRIHGNATFGAFGSDEGFRGSFEALAPLAFDGRQLLFLYPEFMADDEGAQFYSIGLGYRVLLDQPNIILGANIFYDNGESPYDNRVHRLGLGAEVLGERFSARINYYFSDGDEHLIDSRTLSSSSTSSKVVGRSSSAGAITRSPGGTFQSVTTTTKIRTTTTTTSRTFERFEQGMDGLDAELGFQIPLPEKLRRLPEIWLYAGYYNYNSDYGRDLDGFKARAELRFGDRFTIDAAYYEDDGLIGSHWLAGARVHIPFGGGYEAPLGWAGKRGVMTASAEPYGDGASPDILMSRMTENIIRDGKTYTSQSDFIENPDLRRVSRRSRTTERVSTSLRQIEVNTDIIFVDGANQETGDGSFDNPFQNLSLAQAEAQARASGSGLEQTIYVFDTSPGYEEAVTFNGSGIAGFSVNLLDSSNPITFGGTPIGGADPKTRWTAPDGLTPLVLTNIDQFELSGFNITSQAADTLFAQNVGRLVLNDTMLNAMPGRALHLDGVTQVVANNVSADTNGGTNGIRITNSGGPAPSTLSFANTQFNSPAGSAVFLGNNMGSFAFNSLTIDQGASGSGIQLLNNPSGTFTFTDTTITDTNAPGLLLIGGAADVIFNGTSSITRRIASPAIHVLGGHTGDLAFAPGTTVAGIGGGGGLLFVDADGRYDLQGNVTLFESNSGIDIIGDSAGTFTFANTTITDPTTTGLFVDSGSANVTFGGTSSISQSNPMLAVRAGGGHSGSITFDPGTSIVATNGEGLQFNNADGTYNFNGAITLNGGDAGIDILNGSDGTFTFANPTITAPSGPGVKIADSNGDITFKDLTVNNAGASGLDVDNYGGTFLLSDGDDAEDNDILTINGTPNGFAGIDILNSPGGTFTFANVDISNTGAEGALLNNAGTVRFSARSGMVGDAIGTTLINSTDGDAINSTNTNLVVTFARIGEIGQILGDGIEITNNDGQTRTADIIFNNVFGLGGVPDPTGRGIFINAQSGTLHANLNANFFATDQTTIETVDGGAANSLILDMTGNSTLTTFSAQPTMEIVGNGLHSTIVRAWDFPNQVIGGITNSSGILFNRVTFDADGIPTNGFQQVDFGSGDLDIGQVPPFTIQRVEGNGLTFINATGDLRIGTLNIANQNGTGLRVDKSLGLPFNLVIDGGTIDTIGGTAIDIDP